jgi:hypothetical protein
VKPQRRSFGFSGVSRPPLFISVAISASLVISACTPAGSGSSTTRRDRHRDSIRPEASLIRSRL